MHKGRDVPDVTRHIKHAKQVMYAVCSMHVKRTLGICVSIGTNDFCIALVFGRETDTTTTNSN